MQLLLTELSRSVWENLDQGCEYRPNAVSSVHTTKVKILHTDQLSLVNKMFIIWCKQEQFNSYMYVTGLY